MKPLDPRERRLLALGLLVAALALLWLGVVQPLAGGFRDRAVERDQLRATLRRNERLMASIPAWRATATAQDRRADRFAIAAPSEILAVEAFKERLRRLAVDQGLAVPPMEDLQADAPRGTIRIRADMELSLSQLCEILRRLESEGAYVVVDYLSVSADRALITGHLEPMAVRLELTAAWRPTAPRPS